MRFHHSEIEQDVSIPDIRQTPDAGIWDEVPDDPANPNALQSQSTSDEFARSNATSVFREL